MKAMELVSASKMRKATFLTLGTRPYATLIRELTQNVRRLTDPRTERLLVGTPTTSGEPVKTLAIIAASDRGLCGGFNTQLAKHALEFLHKRFGEQVTLVTVGKRAAQVAKRGNYPILASFDAISNAPSAARAKPVTDLALQEFMAGRADRVFLMYMQFKSAMVQVPTIQQILPIVPEEELAVMGHLSPEGEEAEQEEEQAQEEEEAVLQKPKRSAEDEELAALFEPSPEAVLQQLLPRELEMQVYQSLLESSASEHGARMLAMKSAGDAASDMIDDLTLTLNQSRQSAITREISEISAGKAAIE